ncbi:MAG: DUF3784 domain-containing protein [Oscillibacter sp.]|nr:DUF3784 domain-containing protein [Oscillibacter sp.]
MLSVIFSLGQGRYLFNNAYFWASQEERKHLNKNRESKQSHCRQSGFAFRVIGISLLVFTIYIAADWTWVYAAFWVFFIISLIYAVVSSIYSRRHG